MKKQAPLRGYEFREYGKNRRWYLILVRAGRDVVAFGTWRMDEPFSQEQG